MKKILVILGPTSTGKTDLGLLLAKKFNGELVSCDSRQVYKGLDIGTGKAPSGIFNFQFSIFKMKDYWEIDGIKIWLYDVVDPDVQYSVADYAKDANKVIDDISKRGKLPIIAGGTGFYLRALLEGLPSFKVPIDKKLREQLSNLTVEQLQKKLHDLDKKKLEGMNCSDRQNPRRLIRAIELALTHFTSEESLWVTVRGGIKILKIGLTAPKEILYKRSDVRVINRINQGMIEETGRLYKSGLTFERMKQLGLEYGVLADYLTGKIKNKEELVKILQFKIRRFIKKQLTWFKKEKNIEWFDITEKNYAQKVEKRVVKWYYQSYVTEN